MPKKVKQAKAKNLKIQGRQIMTNTEGLKPGGIPRIGNKVAIIGCAETTKDRAAKLFKQPGWEFWGINTLHKTFPTLWKGDKPPATRWFQVHKYERAIDEKHDYDHWNWTKRQKHFPIYMLGPNQNGNLNFDNKAEEGRNPFKEVQMAVPYPRKEVTEAFGYYFTNSISWMLALAIYEGFPEIHMYGIEMALSGEYGYQRPSVEYFVGIARGMGLKVYLPERCDLLKTTVLYGYEDHKPMAEKLRQQRMEFKNREAQMMKTREQVSADRNACNGALQMADKWGLDKDKLLNPSTDELKKRVQDCQNQEMQLMQQVLTLRGGTEMLDYVERSWLQQPKTGGE